MFPAHSRQPRALLKSSVGIREHSAMLGRCLGTVTSACRLLCRRLDDTVGSANERLAFMDVANMTVQLVFALETVGSAVFATHHPARKDLRSFTVGDSCMSFEVRDRLCSHSAVWLYTAKGLMAVEGNAGD